MKSVWFSLFLASEVVSFNDGSSSLMYKPSPGPRRTSEEVISLKFKTLRNSGTLLHAEGREGLGLSLELEKGKLLLLLRPGTKHQYAHLTEPECVKLEAKEKKRAYLLGEMYLSMRSSLSNAVF